MKKYLQLAAMLLVIPALSACGEAYRYPCQDPENWDKKICQKPYCSANGTCPEDLTHYEKDKRQAQPQQFNSFAPRGDCR